MDEIRRDVQLTSRETGRARLDDRVMEAMARVPRHEFVPTEQRRYAYRNRPLPIGYGQTISQPYIVALMTDL
ncbi:MAG: protein-L-isoaspartate O-methyltransferase, partial [Thermoanaerobaculia bacterium]